MEGCSNGCYCEILFQDPREIPIQPRSVQSTAGRKREHMTWLGHSSITKILKEWLLVLTATALRRIPLPAERTGTSEPRTLHLVGSDDRKQLAGCYPRFFRQ